MERLCIGIIGGGQWFSAMHAPALDALKGLGRKVLACQDQERAKVLCAKWGYAARYLDYREMLEKEKPDAVYVITPPAATAEIARSVLQKGVPVFMEKPPAPDPEALATLEKAARRYGTPNFVAFNRRHIGLMKKARDWARRQRGLSHVSVDFLRHDTRAPEHLMSSALHAADALRFLCGEAGEVQSLSGTVNYGDGKKVAYGGLIRFESGVLGTFAYNCRSGRVSEKYALFSENRTLEVELRNPGTSEGRCLLELAAGKIIRREKAGREALYVLNGILAEHEYFLNCLRRGKPMVPDVSDAGKSMRLAESINRGIRFRA